MNYKAIFGILIAFAITIVGCSKSDNDTPNPTNMDVKVSLDVKFDDAFEGTLYPSTIFSFASLKILNQEELTYFDVTINSDKEFDGRIKITNDKFIRETVVDKTIKAGKNVIPLNVLWKFDDFVNITTSGYTHFKVELMDKSNKVIATKNVQLSYRSINECVFATKKEDGSIVDLRFLFASYVNEDSKLIDMFLSAALKRNNEEFGSDSLLNLAYGWAGYQAGEDYLDTQVEAIIYQLYKLGMQYSSITDTSNAATKIYSQNVRFINESLLLQNANCVDGTVLLASILEKIGIRCFLVLEPGHMYLAYSSTGKTEISLNDLNFVETTLISTGDMVKIMKDKGINAKQNFISIRKAREAGIKPIQ